MSKLYEIYKQNLYSDEDNKISNITLDKIMLNIDKELDQKDHRIAELEKENEEKEDKILDLKSYNSDLKETISKLSFSAVRCQAINDEVCQYILDNELLKKENAELKQKLQNAIVPRFLLGQSVWCIYNYEDKYGKMKTEIINEQIYRIHLWNNSQCPLIIGYELTGYENEMQFDDKVFATEQEAIKALDKLNKN